ncbi:lysozyme [Cronobacter malonaticus]|uniref:lysozyme n=1 Tax=Cronobacter malonaticus TaxID=413503 RepID=UPI000518F16D|nr:lysozyme [Cronobacter malonaticus]EGT4370516.1 lysozyme [Cronobacter malonaticus]MDI6466678.1 lysozyme [Cronobacter malonaticus]HAU5448964.1 lysozyme [Cronobacter malonaticus]
MNIRKVGAAGGACSVMAAVMLVLAGGNVRTNQEGLELIGNAEGCRVNPYVCPAGVLTDGIGNTHGVRYGKTMEQIAEDWERNILEAERCVNRYGAGDQLSDSAFSAATSLTFRVGCGKVKGSTLFQMFRQGEQRAACDQFLRWRFAGGKELPGLVARSQKERALCLKE